MTTQFVLRAEWGAAPPRGGTPRSLAEVVGTTWHHTTGRTLRPSLGDYDAWLRAIQQEHFRRGYADIAYTALFDAQGRIYQGRSNDIVGAHALSAHNVANRRTFGIAYLGSGDQLTPAACTAMRAYVYVQMIALAPHRPAGAAPLAQWLHRQWAVLGGTPTYCPANGLALEVHKLERELHR